MDRLIAKLVGELEAAGVTLEVNGDRFRPVPKGRVSPAQLDLLKTHKACVLAYLRQRATPAVLVERWEREQAFSPSARAALDLWRQMDRIEAALGKLVETYYQDRRKELLTLDARWRKGLEIEKRRPRGPQYDEQAFRNFAEIVVKAAPIVEELTEERPDLMDGLQLSLLDPDNGEEQELAA